MAEKARERSKLCYDVHTRFLLDFLKGDDNFQEKREEERERKKKSVDKKQFEPTVFIGYLILLRFLLSVKRPFL